MKSIPRFSEKTLQFIQRASRQKNPDWLEKNRNDYEENLLNPLQYLVQTLQSKLSPLARDYHFPQKGIGRIKRSANWVDESGHLYKDWISYSASRPRSSRFEMNPNLYLEIDPTDPDGDQFIIAGGLYMPSSPQTRAIREAIAKDATPFQKLFSSKAFSAAFKGGFSKDRTSSRPPRGFDKEHPHIDWLKLQAFFVWKSYSKKEFSSANFAEQVVSDCKQILRMNALLEDAIQGRASQVPAKTKSAKLFSQLDGVVVTPRKLDF